MTNLAADTAVPMTAEALTSQVRLLLYSNAATLAQVDASAEAICNELAARAFAALTPLLTGVTP